MTAHFVNLLDDLRRRSLRMAAQVEDMVHEAGEAIFNADEALARRVIERDAEVDAEEVEVEAETIRLMALYQPVGIDLRVLCTVLKVNNDLERIADCAVNVAERARRPELTEYTPDHAILQQMCPLVQSILRKAVQAYGTDDVEVAQQVLHDDSAIDAVYAEAVQQVIRSLSPESQETAARVALLLVAKNFERIADHATNIAEDVIFLATGKIVRHEERNRANIE